MKWFGNILLLDLVDLAFLALFVLVFILFLLDFKLTGRRSWAILLGMVGLGGALLIKYWLRKQILKELEEREKINRQKEKELEELKKEARISEAAYRQALKELEEMKKQHALALARLDRELHDKLTELDQEYSNLTPDETLEKLRKILSN